jgi:glycosyltransferase involved in cell wall biosynthesis
VVGISLLTLVPGIVGGSETYARELVRGLARVGELEYRVFTPTIAADAADGLPGRVVDAYPASWTIPGRLAAMTRTWLRPGPVRRQLELDRLDAIHFPLTVMLPPVDRPPALTTVVDIQHEYLPRFFSLAELTYRRLVYPRTLRRSRLLIAISEHTKATLVERLRVPAERVRVIHLGVDLERFRPDGGERLPFLLYPASRWPHKNHERLFEALALLRRDRPELTLVLTGAGHEGKPAPDGVDVRGRVSEDELVHLYRTASAVVFPSLYEGFGQPTLEAMACGCPVASSDAAALPEVCGDAARYFDATSPEAIAETVADVLSRPDEFARRGLERVRRFTWDECARRHDAVYRELGA